MMRQTVRKSRYFSDARGLDHRRRCVFHPLDEFAHGHAGDEVGAGDEFLDAVAPDHHAGHTAALAADPHHLSVEEHLPASALDFRLHGLPHHAGAPARVIELLDQRRNLVFGPDEHAHDGAAQRQILDALLRPLR